MSSFNLTQHVNFPTHNQNHILDLVITSSDFACSISVCYHCSPFNHFPISTKLSVDRTPLPPPTFHSFRRLHSIDINFFLSDLQCSRLITNPPNSLGFLLLPKFIFRQHGQQHIKYTKYTHSSYSYNTTLYFIFDKRAPVVTKSPVASQSIPWFTSTLHAFKYDTIRYDSVYLTCSKKLTGSHCSSS